MAIKDIEIGIQREQAEKFLLRMLKALEETKYYFVPELGDQSDDPFAIAMNLSFDFRFRLNGKTVEITDEGDIRGYCATTIYADRFEFYFDINRVFKPGRLKFICVKKVWTPWGKKCVLWLPIVMPNLPPIHFKMHLLSAPVYAADISLDISDISAERDHEDPSKLLPKVRIECLSVSLLPNESDLRAAIIRFLSQSIRDTLGLIPILGTMIRYVSDFVDKIAGALEHSVGLFDSLRNYVIDKLKRIVTEWIEEKIWNPNVTIKLKKNDSEIEIADGIDGPEPLEPVKISLESFKLDVNTDCPQGPEVRIEINVDEGSELI